MRAFMSQFQYRGESEPQGLPGQHVSLSDRLRARENAAEHEARRILRETESREERGSISWVSVGSMNYWQRVCARKPQARPLWRDQNAAALALADALRAFVGEGE